MHRTRYVAFYVTLLAPGERGAPAHLFRLLKGSPAHGACALQMRMVCKALGFPRLLPRGARKSQVSHVRLCVCSKLYSSF
jgi:hypothetical protein